MVEKRQWAKVRKDERASRRNLGDAYAGLGVTTETLPTDFPVRKNA